MGRSPSKVRHTGKNDADEMRRCPESWRVSSCRMYGIWLGINNPGTDCDGGTPPGATAAKVACLWVMPLVADSTDTQSGWRLSLSRSCRRDPMVGETCGTLNPGRGHGGSSESNRQLQLGPPLRGRRNVAAHAHPRAKSSSGGPTRTTPAAFLQKNRGDSEMRGDEGAARRALRMSRDTGRGNQEISSESHVLSER